MVKIKKKLPSKFTRGTTTYIPTGFGTYMDDKEYGMVQEKNSLTIKDLLKYGYTPHYEK